METRRAVACCYCGALAPSSPPPESCGECGTFAPFVRVRAAASIELPALAALDASRALVDLSARLIPTHAREWDEALSDDRGHQGLPLGASLFVFGRAGSQKTTRLGALADSFAEHFARSAKALLVSAEQPAYDAQALIARVRDIECLHILGAEHEAHRLEVAMACVLRMKPKIVVYDSLQCFDAGGAPAGSPGAVSASLRVIRRTALGMSHVAVIISRVNARGRPEGAEKNSHDCDVVVHLSRASIHVEKNRFGKAPVRVRLSPARRRRGSAHLRRIK